MDVVLSENGMSYSLKLPAARGRHLLPALVIAALTTFNYSPRLLAQTAPVEEPRAVPPDTLPRQENPPSPPTETPSTETLSDRLKRNNGVLVPPAAMMDEKIHVPAPVPNPNTTPVIPPPGSSGGDPDVQPR